MRRLGDFHEQKAESGVAAGPPWRALGSLALLWDVLKREHPQRRPVRAGGAPEARLPSNHLSFLLPLPIPSPAVVGAKPSAGSAPPELFQLPLVPGARRGAPRPGCAACGPRPFPRAITAWKSPWLGFAWALSPGNGAWCPTLCCAEPTRRQPAPLSTLCAHALFSLPPRRGYHRHVHLERRKQVQRGQVACPPVTSALQEARERPGLGAGPGSPPQRPRRPSLPARPPSSLPLQERVPRELLRE